MFRRRKRKKQAEQTQQQKEITARASTQRTTTTATTTTTTTTTTNIINAPVLKQASYHHDSIPCKRPCCCVLAKTFVSREQYFSPQSWNQEDKSNELHQDDTTIHWELCHRSQRLPGAQVLDTLSTLFGLRFLFVLLVKKCDSLANDFLKK